MRITTVRYGRLCNTGNYQNVRIEVEAEVNEGEDASDALLKLKRFVDSKAKLATVDDEELSRARKLVKAAKFFDDEEDDVEF